MVTFRPTSSPRPASCRARTPRDGAKYNEELVKAGVMLAGEGLHPTSKGALDQFGATSEP